MRDFRVSKRLIYDVSFSSKELIVFYWLRECAGWSLVIFALVIFSQGMNYVANRQVVEGGIVLFAAVGLVRTGILLIRLSTAARIAASTITPGKSP